MRINLITDAPDHNLALMKVSAYHKKMGDTVILNNPLAPADKTYASVLFAWNKQKFIADEYGGVQFPDKMLPKEMEYIKPDYDLYGLDYSLGYTFRPCYRRCDFCLVKTLNQPDRRHHSIHEFHDPKFKKICIMNNNWFLDPLWKQTFEEVWSANLIVKEHGLDIRLVGEEQAAAIKRTKWDGRLHMAWDRMRDEELIVRGLKFIMAHKIEARFYVLCGYDTNWEQDLYRCQILINHNQVPYVMPFKDVGMVSQVKNYINSMDWWHYKDNIKRGFNEWQKGVVPEQSKASKAKKVEDEKNGNLFD